MEIILKTEYETAMEYKIGNTTYVVTIKYNKSGENLEDIISRLIARDIEEAA